MAPNKNRVGLSGSRSFARGFVLMPLEWNGAIYSRAFFKDPVGVLAVIALSCAANA